MLANEVRNGIVSIGHQIKPKFLSKLFVKKNAIEKEQITVEAHKQAQFTWDLPKSFDETQ